MRFSRGLLCAMATVLLPLAGMASADSIITQWNFNNATSAATPAPSTGLGSARTFSVDSTNITTAFNSSTGSGGSSDPAGNSAWEMFANNPICSYTIPSTCVGLLSCDPSAARGVEFSVSTVGYTEIKISCDIRFSSTASRFIQIFYSTDGTTFTPYSDPFETTLGGDLWYRNVNVNLTSITAANNNPNFKFRIAPVYDPSSSNYIAASTPGSCFSVGGNKYRYDMVTVSGFVPAPTNPTLTQPSVTPGAVCTTGGSVTISTFVSPGLNPISTGISVAANCSALVGGSASVPMYDDATHGDAQAGDSIYTATVSFSGGQSLGLKNIPITATDGQARQGSASVSLNVVDCSANAASRVVISQVFGGGSNLGPPASPFNADYVELFNRSAQTVSLDGWSVQYAGPIAADGFGSSLDQVFLCGDIKPGQYMLVRFKNAGNTGASLPSPDFAVGPDAGGMGNNGGRVALVRSPLLVGTNCADPLIEDLVGYGDAALCFEGGSATLSTANDTAAIRALGGAQDTNQNFNDFTVGAPNPHNRAFGGFLAGFGSASPSIACLGSTLRITVAVSPATSPASTGIQVLADLSSLNGPVAAALYDDATHGDTTQFDGIFTLDYTIPTSAPTGAKSLPIVVSDAQLHSDHSCVRFSLGSCASTAPIVISQVFGGGGNALAPFNADFAEIFNRSAAPVSLAGWSLQYADSTGPFLGNRVIDLSATATSPAALTIGPGEYRLIQVGAPGINGGALPSPDFIPTTFNGADNHQARFAIVNSTTLIGSNCGSASIVDMVGYGISSICYEGFSPLGALDNNFVALRKLDGCQDTNQSSLDFDIIEPSQNPRNSASPANPCALPSGACCTGTHCATTTIAACTGSFQGPASACGPVGNPTTCCRANFNAVNGLSIQDIFDFLNAWFAGNPAADFNGNGLNVQDIFDFLNAWFAGC